MQSCRCSSDAFSTHGTALLVSREAATDVNQLLTCLELLLATHDSTDFRRLHATVRRSEHSITVELSVL